MLGVVLTVFIFAVLEQKDPEKDYRNLFRRYTHVFSPEVPSKANFSGEEVPLNIYYVREALEREIMASTFMHSSTMQMFKRAYRWFPVIEPILKKNGIPDDFKFLAVAESNLGNVVSPSGAEGPWQFLKATGQKYGLEINQDVDERYNLEKATEAACAYFKEAFGLYKSWTLVAASYNRGMEGVSKALEKQKVNTYYDLFLNDETSRYVFRIIAIKQVYNHPTRFGFYTLEQHFYSPVSTKMITVDSTIRDLPSFAIARSINYRILRELNPWIQNYSLPNKTGKIYVLKLPKDSNAISMEALSKKTPVRDHFFHDTLMTNEIH